VKNDAVLFKVGDLVRVRLPHTKHDGAQALIMSDREVCHQFDDAWVRVLIEGQSKVIHVDYIREVYNETR
jgi:hypothetical protein